MMWIRRVDNEQGQLMPMVLGLLMVAAMISVTFVAFVVARQQLAGHRYRLLAARYAAEAGIEQTIWELQAQRRDKLRVTVPLGDDPARGSFVVESVEDQGGGLVQLLASGTARGLTRSVRATVKMSPTVLRYALFGDHLLRFEGADSRTYVVPASHAPDCAAGDWIGSNREIWIATAGVAINDFTGALLSLREGRWPDHALTANGAAPAPLPVGQLILPDGAALTFGAEHRPIDDLAILPVEQVRVGAAIVAGGAPEGEPLVDRASLRALAEGSAANAEINETVGRRTGRAMLRLKRNSLYEPEEFAFIVRYLAHAPAEALHGPVLVQGSVVILDGAAVRVLDGFLATVGSLTIETGGRLEVRHSPASRLFPAVVTIGDTAPLVVHQRATLVADGLVYAARIFDAGEGAMVDIVGALIGGDPLLSFRNHNATVVIRYDPVVLGTIGIRPHPAAARAIARIVGWTEVR